MRDRRNTLDEMVQLLDAGYNADVEYSIRDNYRTNRVYVGAGVSQYNRVDEFVNNCAQGVEYTNKRCYI